MFRVIVWFASVLAVCAALLAGAKLSSKKSPHARIYNGYLASKADFPYIVGIRANEGTLSHFCGGTIIAKNFILTAAHCTKGFEYLALS